LSGDSGTPVRWTVNTMNQKIKPDRDAPSSRVPGAGPAAFNLSGPALFGDLAAIGPTQGDGVGGKLLFCRLPSTLQSALLDRLAPGARSEAQAGAADRSRPGR
jgi:hypothetical protein